MTQTAQATAGKRLSVGILGSGNIGTDLMYKVLKSPVLDLKMVAGIEPNSDGLARARSKGVPTSAKGADGLLACGGIDVVLDATGAKAHLEHAPRLQGAGMRIVDLTPAKLGPSIVPCVNMDRAMEEGNVNLISCAAQATIPLIYGFSRVAPVRYAEIIATIASNGAGLAARQNIEEFKTTTEKAIVQVGGAKEGKAMVIFNPAEPPIRMRNTVYVEMEDDEGADEKALHDSVMRIAEDVRKYVPGYEVTVPPFRRGNHFMVSVEIAGAGDYLPAYAGNLDIINAAAVAILEKYASTR
mgnify:CR=1 FL=1